MLSDFFKKTPKNTVTIKVDTPQVPPGMLRKCKKCGSVLFVQDVKARGEICPKCGAYFRMKADQRIESICDAGSFVPVFENLPETNLLDTAGYPEKLAAAKAKTGLDEAVVTGFCTIGGMKTALAVCDGRFFMASMGQVVGEKIVRLVEQATDERLPVIIVACSGGARMQEGIVSLMQMVKTSQALKRHSDAGELFISLLTDPTTGGVTASFAMLGDILISEPDAMIGFAGPRVIEQTIGQKLPKGFQRSEYLLEHGFLDQIVTRPLLREHLEKLLKMHGYDCRDEKKIWQRDYQLDEISACDEELADCACETSGDEQKTAWERVLLSRSQIRPIGEDYIQALFTDFTEMHGDRRFGDDAAIVGGIARFHGMPVTVIAQVKGHNTKESMKRNFGMPSPEGYRKALRLMRQAEKFGRPVICFVDTPGAFCGLEAEARGQGEAIAENLFMMSGLKIPVLSVMIGEGGSGGALAMAVSNEVWMLENSIYSILSPEGYASILWKDAKRAQEAAGVMKITAEDLLSLGIVEKVFEEPEGFSKETMGPVIAKMEQAIAGFLKQAAALDGDTLANQRYERFRKM